ncbi:heparan-alpha-glucosaminide N-acetyltransferase [Oceaniglobus indicus]|uniref:heparan-alpha-glucosaminide N-acetyltransferase n=1 Tax=Oceaniglobus indicus TaxID=2047749 RepID=UPI000C188399|nr:heparan-alpha-glucosaminide N-acetyltransferase [Oceaniglobus indicus]
MRIAESDPGRPRVAAIDIARTVALLGMAVYHLIWDLMLFGLIPAEVALSGGFRWLAVVVAASFLFLAGVSLMLAHGRHLNVAKALKRIAVIAAAAALVTVATWFAMPDAFVYFGILHSIAAASLVGLLLLRLPWLATLAIAAATFALPQVVRHGAFDHPALLWTGLHVTGRATVDYEPFFPWAAATFAGIALVQATRRSAFWTPRPVGRTARRLGWPGRHSLAIYLIHQPVLIALVWLTVQIRLAL